jgi:hypothetical protein
MLNISMKGPAHDIHLIQASLDRGFGRCQVMRKQTALIRRYPNGT